MNTTYPCIKVCDIEISISWYTDFLGFQCVHKSSLRNPDCAILEKEGQKIYLLKDESGESYASNVIIIETDDIGSEYTSQEENGVIIVQAIESGTFGGSEFVIKDYEDNKIVFKQSES
jgi:catechol 2,3-dioxygenase-like lactoylglutathione lyase family enzyme